MYMNFFIFILKRQIKIKKSEKLLITLVLRSFLRKNIRNPCKHFKIHFTVMEMSKELETFQSTYFTNRIPFFFGATQIYYKMVASKEKY